MLLSPPSPPTTTITTSSSSTTQDKKKKRKRKSKKNQSGQGDTNNNHSNNTENQEEKQIKKKKKKQQTNNEQDEKLQSKQLHQNQNHDNNKINNNNNNKTTSSNNSITTKPIIHPNMFESVSPPLSSGILSSIKTYFKFTSMTPVQAAVIPLFLQNKDVCVQAVTGSGKTLAFLIPMVEMILRRTTLLSKKQIGGLIISPTRELARQTFVIAKELCHFTSLSEPLLLVGGGSGYRPVKDDLSSFAKLGSDIVIGTPGRIDDILSRYSDLQMNELECLVLDEADVLLAMGFEVTLTNILSRLPKMRRTGLFSATRSGTSGGEGNKSVKRLMTRAGLRNPVMINVAIACNNNNQRSTKNNNKNNNDNDDASSSDQVDAISSHHDDTKPITPQEQATPTSLTNYYIISPLDEQLSRLVAFIKQHPNDKIIIFFMTCANVEYFGLALTNLLPKSQFYIELLHGRLAPKRREKAMERFRNGGVDDDMDGVQSSTSGGILLCTDVAARGLDVPDIHWTIQFDAPVDPAQYIHRVGRSARAGKFGSSLIFLSPKEESFIDFLRMRKVPIEEISNDEVCSPNRSIVKKDNKKEKSDDDDEESDESKDKISIPDILTKIRNMVLHDRDLLEKGTKAFTSYIRAYKEHQMQFIFRFASLDLGILATSFSLLRLPKMPELKDKLGKLNFKPAGPEIDIHAIKYKDKVREKARQKRLAAELAAGGKNAKQIKAEQRTAAKLQREKDRRQAEIKKGRNPDKKKGKQARIFDEWDDLAKEERLHKKLKQGKITKEKYKELMYGEKSGSNNNAMVDDSDDDF